MGSVLHGYTVRELYTAKIFRDRSFPVKLGDKRVVTMLWFVGVKERANFFSFFLFSCNVCRLVELRDWEKLG